MRVDPHFDSVSDSRAREFARKSRVALVAASRRRIIPAACSFVRCRCSRSSWYEPPSSPPRCVLHLCDSAMRDAIHGRKYENPIMREPPLQPRFSSLPLFSPHPPRPFYFALGYMFIICFRVTHKFPRFSRWRTPDRSCRLFQPSPLPIPRDECAFAPTFGEKDGR